MSFTNLYYKRTAGTPKACYVCYKPTTTVLATKDTVDFLYSCDGHLKDPGFASLVATPAPELQKAPAVSAEEIARVKKEWEDKQKKKREAEEKKKDEEKKDGEETKVKVIKSPPATSSPAPPATPTHERYTLHRDFFAMRLTEHRKRRQTKAAKDLAPRLPGVPT